MGQGHLQEECLRENYLGTNESFFHAQITRRHKLVEGFSASQRKHFHPEANNFHLFPLLFYGQLFFCIFTENL